MSDNIMHGSSDDWNKMNPKFRNRLLSELTRLKAEVERLTEGNECLDQMHEKEMARSAFLCEEVNRTTAWGRGLESDLSWARAELLMVKAEVERLTAFTTRTIIPNEELQAQVERLTKAGDAVALDYAERIEIEAGETAKTLMKIVPVLRDWNAAKEGKGQP